MTNNEASAYAKVAMVNCGISPLTIGRVMNEMGVLYDRYTEHEIVRQVDKEGGGTYSGECKRSTSAARL